MSIFAELSRGVSTASPEKTRAIGRRLAEELPEEAVVTLSGDLGAGKTVLVKGLAEGLGVAEEVTSPTFNIFTLYEGKRRLIHLDAYRLESGEQVESLMLDDFLLPPFCLAVEWPGKIAEWLPPERINLFLSISSDRSHRIRMG